MKWVDMAIERILQDKIAHRNWNHALSLSFSMMHSCAPGEVIYITGPSRGGKSRMIDELLNMLRSPEDKADGVMPGFSVLAENCNSNGSFSTKNFTISSLTAIQHPIYGQGIVGSWDDERLSRIRRTSEGLLRDALEAGIRARGCRFMFVDEAQHVMFAQRGLSAADGILSSWKCLAQATGIVLVLVGAYPLLRVLSQSPHLLARKHEVHLPRYHETVEDIQEFRNIVYTYDEILKTCSGSATLLSRVEELYFGSLGCIGLLQSWLRGALAIARCENSRTLEWRHLKSVQMSGSDLKTIEEEIIEGENMMANGEQSEDVSALPTKPSRKKVKGRPFQKKPRRYPVGVRG